MIRRRGHFRGQLGDSRSVAVVEQRTDPGLWVSERDFREAIELSRKIGAKSPELRTTACLARLLRDTGRPNDARTMLAEVYNWFTEGFDTADLKHPKALLNELEF